MKHLHRAKLHVPILDVFLELFVGTHPQMYEATQKLIRYRGLVENNETFRGLSIETGRGYFAVLLREDGVSHELLSHELFHQTNNIWDYVGDTPKKKSEGHAYLCGFLTRWVYKQLLSQNIRITND